jgi:hypothetical protein
MGLDSVKTRKRFIEISNNNELMFGDEMEILQHLVNKFNLISSSEYARINGISRAGVRHRVNKEPTIKIGKLNYFVV